jgi:large subunit ribosomal protein L25
VQISKKSIQEVLKKRTGEGSTLLKCSSEMDSSLKGLRVLLKQLEWDAFGRHLLHVDLHVVRMDETIETRVPIRTAGEPIGVKEDNGVLEVMKHALTIECLPGDIPEAIEVDVSGLRIGNVLHVADLPVAQNLRIKEDPAEAVIALASPMSEEAEKTPEEEVSEEAKTE